MRGASPNSEANSVTAQLFTGVVHQYINKFHSGFITMNSNIEILTIHD